MLDDSLTSLTLADGKAIDVISTDFERAWHSDQRQRIEDLLWSPERTGSRELLLELILTEWSLLRENQQPVELAQYLARFPQVQDVLPALYQREVVEPPIPAAEQDTVHSGSAQDTDSHNHTALQIPKRIGPYDMSEQIGSGGMSQVFRARHRKMDRDVAIKLLPVDKATEAQAIGRFEREMKAIGRVHHENVVLAHDAGESDGFHYIAMELVDGIDGSRLIRQHGTLEIADACEIVRQAALGLQAAHEQKLVHRDVKPSNLLLTRDGKVKLLDLGLARLKHESPTSSEATSSSGDLTSAYQVMGTVDYMAPEQANNTHGADIRADIYGLGCTLYAFLAGHPPFPSTQFKDNLEKLFAHAKTPPQPLQELRGDIPPELDRVLKRMLAKTPAERFAIPADVARALLPLTKGQRLATLLRLDARAAETDRESQDPDRAFEPTMLTTAPSTDDASIHPQFPSDATTQLHRTSNHESDPSAASASGLTRESPARRLLPIGAAILAIGALILVFNRDPVTTPQNNNVSINTSNPPPVIPSSTGQSTEVPAVMPTVQVASEVEIPEADLPPLELGPLDKLDPTTIHAIHREPGLPDGVVGVLGDTRWRHWGPVAALAFSPDDKLLASGDATGLIKVWDVETKLPVAYLKGHQAEIAALVFSHDGKWLASASTIAEPVRLWAVAPKEWELASNATGLAPVVPALLHYEDPAPSSSAKSPASEQAVKAPNAQPAGKPDVVQKRGNHPDKRGGVEDQIVRTPPLITQSRALPIKNRIWQLVFNADDSRLIALENIDDNRHTIVEWDAKLWRETRRFTVKPGSIVLAPSAKFAFAGTRAEFPSTAPVLWDVDTGEASAAPASWKAIGTPAAVSSDDRFFATFHDDFADSCRIWNSQTGELVASPGGFGHEFSASMNSQHVGFINLEGRLHLYAIASGQETASFSIGTGTLEPRCLALSPKDKFAAVGSQSGRVFLVPTDSKGKTPIQQRDLAFAPLKNEPPIAASSAWYLSFSPTQPRAMVASREGDITEWDLATLRPIGNPIPQAAWSTSCSSDGKQLALTANGATQIWDVAQRKRGARWPVGGAGFVAFAQGGQTLVQSNGNKLTAWDVSDEKEVGVVPGVQEAEVSNVAADREGRFVVYGVGNKVKVANPTKARVVSEYTSHQGLVRCVAISADGKLAASIGDDRTVRVWELETDRERLVLRGHDAEGWGLSFSPDGKLLVSCAYDGRVILWDTRAAEPLYGKLHEWQLPGKVHRVFFAPDGRHVATVNFNGTSYVLRVPSWITASVRRGKVPSTPNERALANVGWALLPVSSRAGLRASPSESPFNDPTSAAETQSAKTTDTNAKGKTGRSAHPTSEWSHRPQTLVADPAKLPGVRRWSIETKGHRGIVRSVQYSPDGKWLATAGDDAAIRLWNAQTRGFERVLLGHADTIRELRWSPDSQTLATASDDRTIRMWDVATGRVTRVLTGHEGAIGGFDWSHTGDLLASRAGSQLIVWDAKSGTPLSRIRNVSTRYSEKLAWLFGDQKLISTWGFYEHCEWVRGSNQVVVVKGVGDFGEFKSSPVSDLFAGGQNGGGRQAVLVNSQTNKPLKSLAHGGDVTALAWSRDGKSLATTGHFPNGVKVWDIESGQVLRSMFSRSMEPRDYNTRGYSSSFSLDGVQLVVGGFDIETEVFEFKGLKTQQHLLYPSRANRIVSSSLTADGKLLATLTHDGSVRVWSKDGRLLAIAPHDKAVSVSWVPKTEPPQLAIDFAAQLKFFEFTDKLAPASGSREITHQLGLPGNAVGHDVSWSSDGKFVCIRCERGKATLVVGSRATDAGLSRIDLPLEYSQQAVSPNGSHVAVAHGFPSTDIVSVYETQTGKLAHTLPVGSNPRCVAWSPDGKQLATYSQGKGQVVVWDVATQQTRCLLLPPASAPLPFVAPDQLSSNQSPSGLPRREDASPATNNNRPSVSGSKGISPPGQARRGKFDAVAFTAAPPEAALVTTLHWLPDNQTLITVSDDRLLRVWNTATGELLRTVESPSSVMLTTNGDEFVTATPLGSLRGADNAGPEAGLIRRFELKTGQPSTTIVPLRDNHWLSLTADGHYQGSPQIDEEIVYVIETDAGQETLTPAEFAKRFNWQN